MNYGQIKYNDISNGEGVRTSLFVSGCRQHCAHCFNKETWDFDYGLPFTESVQEEILASLRSNYIAGLSVLGGEPMEPENQEGLLPFLQKVKANFPEKNIWLYTGYLFEKDMIPGGRKYTEYTEEILSCVDVLVDGPFVEILKDISLKFRGSSNQRIIRLKE